MGHSIPFFSIVIPTYRRPVQLAECLEAVSKLDYPRDRFEVIVVDDGTEALPKTVVDSFLNRLAVRLVTQSHGGPAKARNTGAAQARGRYLAFVDDDCLPATDWLSTLAKRLDAEPVQIIGGQTINVLAANPYATTSQFIQDISYSYYNADPAQARFFATNNMVVPAEQFKAVGRFDDAFWTSEDRELCNRWRRHGYRMTYAPAAVVYHAHRLTFTAFCRQHFNYGRGALRFHRKRRRSGETSSVVDFGYYIHALRYLSGPGKGSSLSLILLCCVWQVVNLGGFLYEWLKPSRGWSVGGIRADVRRNSRDKP